jgi:hypothetical protein
MLCIRLFISIIYKTKVRPSVSHGQQAISFSRTKIVGRQGHSYELR